MNVTDGHRHSPTPEMSVGFARSTFPEKVPVEIELAVLGMAQHDGVIHRHHVVRLRSPSSLVLFNAPPGSFEHIHRRSCTLSWHQNVDVRYRAQPGALVMYSGQY